MSKLVLVFMISLMPLSSYGQEKSIKDCSVLDVEGNVVQCKDGSIYKLILKQEAMPADNTKVVVPAPAHLQKGVKISLRDCAFKDGNLEIVCSDSRFYTLMTPMKLDLSQQETIRDNTQVITPPAPVINSRKAKSSNRGVAGFVDDAFEGKAQKD